MMVSETITTFMRALETMNRAMRENADTTPYRQMFQAANKYADGLIFGVAVYRDDPAAPHDFYTVRYIAGEFELVDRGNSEVDPTWKVSEQYLQDVANNPERYVDNPAKLDWDWLKSRLDL